MRALVQRVTHGAVHIGGEEHAAIGRGLVVLLGVRRGDRPEGARNLAARIAALRVFDDPAGVPNVNVRDAGGAVLVVSQFTLYGDTGGGNRPSYIDAAPAHEAEPLYSLFVNELTALLGAERVRAGVFRAMMRVTIVNDGPVTVMVESKP